MVLNFLFATIINTTLLVSCYDSKMKTITLPKGSPDPLPELAAYLKPFAPLFRRSTSRSSLVRYITSSTINASLDSSIIVRLGPLYKP